MDDLIWARSTMALSLGFHIIFASISMILPFFMARAHRKYLKTGSAVHLHLTKAWSKGAAILFATGAVSGTALSFQLGLLWPGFMEHAGPIIGMPFSLEGAAFFLEAIFLGLFLYGWDKLPVRWHYLSGVMVGVCGLASGILVIAANGWMNSPSGFDWVDGGARNIDPWAASLAQPLVGDFIAKSVADRQPEKLAAMEAHFETERGAGLLLGGIPDQENETVRYGLKIPKALSFLAHGDFDAKVTGLNEFPRNEQPPVLIVHLAFQVMVGLGTLLAGVSLTWLLLRKFRPAWLHTTQFLKLLVALIPTGFIALEAGWIVTEVGRQPWILYRVIRTADAVTPVPGLSVTFFFILSLYTVLGGLTFLVLSRIYAFEVNTLRGQVGN